RYVAGVIGWRAGTRKATLADDLAKGEGGTMIVVPPRRHRERGRGRDVRRQEPPRRDAQRAITHVTLREQRGNRAVLDVLLETGRTHQARVQLAHAAAPI